MPDFLPRQDNQLLSWSRNFDDKINSDPEEYSLTPEIAAQYRELHDTFAALLQAASQPGTRTPSGIVAKDTARDAMKFLARKICGQIRSRMEITDYQRVAVGIRPRRVHRKAVLPPPQSPPTLRIVSRQGTMVRIEIRDPDSPMRIAKPRGASQVVIRTFIGDEPPVTLQGWRIFSIRSLTRVDVTFPPALPPGTRVWLTAQWVSPTGKTGQSCSPVGTWLAGGEMTAAA